MALFFFGLSVLVINALTGCGLLRIVRQFWKLIAVQKATYRRLTRRDLIFASSVPSGKMENAPSVPFVQRRSQRTHVQNRHAGTQIHLKTNMWASRLRRDIVSR
jgi:hypothetical protein